MNHPQSSPTSARPIATIPGVPDPLAKVLDRRLRLRRQLLAFRGPDRAAIAVRGRVLNDLAGPGLA